MCLVTGSEHHLDPPLIGGLCAKVGHVSGLENLDWFLVSIEKKIDSANSRNLKFKPDANVLEASRRSCSGKMQRKMN